MKKILFAVAVLVYTMLIALSGHSQAEKIPAPVLQSFKDHFKNSQYSRWVQLRDAFVTTYSEDGSNWQDAYFTKEGEFRGVGKHITSDHLPRFVQEKIQSYPNYDLVELYQYECNENGICFFARIRNPKNELVLKMSPYGDVTYSTKTRIKTKKDMTTDAVAKSSRKD